MRIKYSLLVLLLTSVVVYAHGPSRQKIQEQVIINVPVEKVWQRIGNFSDLSWHPVIEKVVMVKGGNNKKGDIRTLVLKSGVIINEKLKKYLPEKMRYDYKIIDMSTVKTIKHLGDEIPIKVLPVSNYSSTIQVAKQGENSTVVTWKGAYYRGFMNNNPPKELTEEVANKAVSGVYRAGLEHLKKILETPKK